MKLQGIDGWMPEVAQLSSAQAASVHGASLAHSVSHSILHHENMLTGDFVASRFRCHHAKRVLIKVGTRVATRAQDERLAIGRLGALAEAVQELLVQKKQVILVICGANTVGRQKLRYQQVLHSSPLEYQRLTQEALLQPAAAAAGQSGVMALWDKLFTMLGVGSAQLLVSQEDLADEQTSHNLQVCVEAILSMGAVPILNENPASPSILEVDNIFIDNDGLTASVAELLTVDLSLFLTNIEGLPWDSTSFGQSQKEQKDHSSHANGTVNTSTAHTHSASAAWMHSSVQSGSAGSGDGPGGVQHPSIISTYCPQVHGQAEDILHGKGDSEEPDDVRNAWGPEHTCSDSSTQSLRSKVAAAWRCAEAGGTAVVMSGLEPENISKVCQGEKVGTMFNKQSALEVCMRGMHTISGAHMSSHALDLLHEKSEETPWSPTSRSSSQKVTKIQSMKDLASEAAAASAALSQQPAEERSKILQAVAAAMEARKDEIMMVYVFRIRFNMQANHMDIASFRAHNVSVPEVSVQRMKLDERRIDSLIEGIKQVANTEDPIGKTLCRTEIAQDLLLEKVSVPLGVVLCIFEARPDVVPQLIALAIRSGNGLLLKGSEEVQNSILLLLSILCAVLAKYGCSSLVGLIQSREDVDDLLEMDGAVDMIVVRGSNTLVHSIRDRTNMPVLGHAEGICCIYIDADVDLEMACAVCLDSKVDYPAACNSVERICMHRKHREAGGLFRLLAAFRKVGVEVYGGSLDVQTLLNVAASPEPVAEFHDLKVILDMVEDMDEAIAYIHTHGSAHTDAICTSSEATADEFLLRVDSSCVFVNCSTRFSDGQRFGLGGEVGISTGRVHARGPVGADGLTSTKYLVRGCGQVVKSDQGVTYTHRKL